MSCEECEKFQEENKIAYYRWGIANVAIIGCPKHLKEIFTALNKIQSEKK